MVRVRMKNIKHGIWRYRCLSGRLYVFYPNAWVEIKDEDVDEILSIKGVEVEKKEDEEKEEVEVKKVEKKRKRRRK